MLTDKQHIKYDDNNTTNTNPCHDQIITPWIN